MATPPAGSAANASLVGAKTVNGPLPERVLTRPPAVSAATRVERSGVATARPTMVCGGPGAGGGGPGPPQTCVHWHHSSVLVY